MVKQAFQKQAAPASNDNNDFDIFLDIDGVIADFEAHLETQGKLDDNGKIKWDELDQDWFSTIPVHDGAQEFHSDLSKLGKVRFLTAPTLSVGCFAGKAQWVSETFLPKRGKYALMDLIIMHKKSKQLIAQPNRILVDDTEANIDSWNEAGGIGIHHKGDFDETLQAVKDAINGKGKPVLELTPEM